MGYLRHVRMLVIVLAGQTSTVHAADVCNAGFPGENSAQVLQRLPKALSDCKAPVAVVLFVGMNVAVNEKRFLAPDQTAEAVAQMLQLIAIAHARSLVVTVH